MPVNLAAMAGKGLSGEILLQVVRGSEGLRAASLRPGAGPWVDADSNLSSADTGNLTMGLQAARAKQLVLNDGDLASVQSPNGITLSQPFMLSLTHGARVTAAATDSQIDSRFVAHPTDPVLAANQLLASLAFVHFENVLPG